MNKKSLTYIIIILIVVVVIFGYYAFFRNNGSNGESGGVGLNDVLAKCLTEKGVKMYGTEWCSYCKKQKEAFGNSFQYIDYIDCDKERSKCTAAGVKGYPTWVISGENYPGVQSFERLSSLSGC